ncbi:hypothetical protein BTR23_16325 [Alkalihalophilus pseudofirmus]|nr:hypothetical protein BTR23_16325 [Alkalihalophilus pseudofirmus]
MARSIWGVDSAAAVTPALYDCVIENFGKPEFWGRYLNTIPNVSDGLTVEEINRLRGNGVRVMPIYNDFAEAVGYRAGEIAAANAIFHARRLGFPTGVRVFANIENFFDVDEAWIRAWVDAFYPSGYKPGFYKDPLEGSFSEEYCAAIANSERVKVQSVLWSAEPEPGVTTKQNRPQRFTPAKPPCDTNVWAWQYGRDADVCPIDTVLSDRRLYDDMW